MKIKFEQNNADHFLVHYSVENTPEVVFLEWCAQKPEFLTVYTGKNFVKDKKLPVKFWNGDNLRWRINPYLSKQQIIDLFEDNDVLGEMILGGKKKSCWPIQSYINNLQKDVTPKYVHLKGIVTEI